MATKAAEKKKGAAAKTAAPAPAPAPVVGELERLATEYLVMRIHQFLVSFGEAARLGDIAGALADEGVNVSLVRHMLGQHPARFLQTDRRWDVRTRYLDRQRPISKLLEEIVANYDAPIAAWDAAHELGVVIGRSPEGTRPIAERLLAQSGAYVPMTDQGGEVKYCIKSWLLDLQDDYTGEDDILFYNFLPAGSPAPYTSLKGLDWESAPVAAALSAIEATRGAAPKVIDNRLLLYLAWKELGDDYVGTELFNQLAASGELVLMPNHRWTNEAGRSAMRLELTRLSEIVAEMPEEEEIADEEITPLTVSESDLDQMKHIVGSSEAAVSAPRMLEEVYDTTPGERSYAQDLQAVADAIRARPDLFEWVGYDRFIATGSLPPYIGQFPESLQFPVVPQIPDANEDLFDQLIEDEGFERGIERDIRNAIAMDAADQDAPEQIIYPNGENTESRSLRLVLKAHHKEIGTFPLCQVPPGFFATEPPIVELTLRDSRGTAYEVYADYNTQLIYGIGLFDLYAGITADSGAVFTLERTATPGEFRFINNSETDEHFYIAAERLEQLQNYRAEIESGPATSTHDIVRYILEHSNSAMSYLSLLAEVNIVRRTTRRQLASILSAWNAFTQKAGLWTYDPKKSASGLNKNKRKYII